MSKLHMPGANYTVQYFARKFTGSTINPNVCVLHTTESGNGWPGYGGGASAPHLTVVADFARKRLVMRQHYPANKSSRALVNKLGGVETNTANAFQIELGGTCDPKYRVSRKEWGRAGVDYIYWPEAPEWALQGVADILRWLAAEWNDFPLKDSAPRGWKAYPGSYGERASQRLTFTEWRICKGVVGHQHVPENTHGDPGNLPIGRIIALAKGGGNSTPEDDMPEPADLWEHKIPSQVPDANKGKGLPAEDYLSYTNRDVRQLVKVDVPDLKKQNADLKAEVATLNAKLDKVLAALGKAQ